MALSGVPAASSTQVQYSRRGRKRPQEGIDDDGGPGHDPVSGGAVGSKLRKMSFGLVEDLAANDRQAALTMQRTIHRSLVFKFDFGAGHLRDRVPV